MNAKRQILPFLFVTLTGLWLLQPLVILLVGMALSSFDDALALFIAKCLATVVSLAWNYVLYSRFVFKGYTRREN